MDRHRVSPSPAHEPSALRRARARSCRVFQFPHLAPEDHDLHHLITKAMPKRRDLSAKFDPRHEVGGKRGGDVREPPQRFAAYACVDGKNVVAERYVVVVVRHLVGQVPQALEGRRGQLAWHLESDEVRIGVFLDRVDGAIAAIALQLLVVQIGLEAIERDLAFDLAALRAAARKERSEWSDGETVNRGAVNHFTRRLGVQNSFPQTPYCFHDRYYHTQENPSARRD